MAIYLLDTNIIVDAINEKRGRNRFLLDLAEQQGHTLACCPINVAEVYAGQGNDLFESSGLYREEGGQAPDSKQGSRRHAAATLLSELLILSF